MMRCAGSIILAWLWVGCGLVAAAEPPDAPPSNVAYFEQHVRPLLAKHCYECHSAQAKQLQGNLLLDSKAGWQHGGDSGPAIVPGKPDDSLLVKSVRYEDDVQMPPSGKLAAHDIAVLRHWVQIGAPDPRSGPAAVPKKRAIDLAQERKHWAYQPLTRAAPPAVQDAAWCRTPIDRFILAKLDEHGIQPNPPADRRRLVRRAYFDLIGLPPTPEEVEAFVRDPAPDAYERLIDRLLASPHYGERWGRHWLDLARFGESHGFEQDYDRPNAYHYRDFVIKALNQDLPFDTFVKWQIAGDEFEPDNPLAMAATGFLSAGVHATQITANQAEKERYDELDDITRTIGTTMLGLTVGCARCHDHKFDPIPTEDYYRLLATFTTTVRSDYDVSLDAAGDRQRKADFDREHQPLVAAREKFEREVAPQRLAAWLKTAKDHPPRPDWIVLDLKLTKSDGGTKFARLEDGSLLAKGSTPTRDVVRLAANITTPKISAIRLEALAHESLPGHGPGRGERGSFTLNKLQLTAKSLDQPGDPRALKLVRARSTSEDTKAPAGAAIDGRRETAWKIAEPAGHDHAAIFALDKPLAAEGGVELAITLTETGPTSDLGRFRVSVYVGDSQPGFDGVEVAQATLPVLEKLAADPGATLPNQDRQAALRWICRHDAEWRKLDQQVREHARATPQPKTVKMLISSEGVPAVRLHTQGPDFYEKTYLLTRGDPNLKRSEVSPGFLRVLMTAPNAEQHWQASPSAGARTTFRRHALAEWMTDPHGGAGQLLARVMVNRLWHYHFGRGIVATPSDFGTQGERPTHPELLDWLAGQLVSEGWQLKPLHKRIMTSSVYMQTCQTDPVRERADSENRWFWHRPLERLEAEVIRDAMLATSGELDAAMFGPGTLDPQQKRRSIYFFIKRSQRVPMMLLFDAPDPLQDMAQRQTTTVAPQALLLLNNEVVRSYAEAFAKRLGDYEPGAARGIVERAYRRAVSRPPDAGELADAVAFLEQQSNAYAAQKRPDSGRLALADLCQVLFELNEFIYVE